MAHSTQVAVNKFVFFYFQKTSYTIARGNFHFSEVSAEYLKTLYAIDGIADRVYNNIRRMDADLDEDKANGRFTSAIYQVKNLIFEFLTANMMANQEKTNNRAL